MKRGKLLDLWARLPNPPYLEVFSAVTAMGWGYAMLHHPEILANARLYSVLHRVAPWPNAVGGTALTLGAFQAVMFAVGWTPARWAAAFLAGSFYFCIMNAIQAVDDTMPGLVMYMSFSGMNLAIMALLFRRRNTA